MSRVLIPIAGMAVRLGGTVKYLLPIFDEHGKVSTLLQEHMRLANALQWNVTALSRMDTDELTWNYLANNNSENSFTVLTVYRQEAEGTRAPTTTMNESVLRGLEEEADYIAKFNESQKLTLMLMGDTFFYVSPKVNRLETLRAYVTAMEELLTADDKTVAVLLLFPIRKEQVGKLGQVRFDAHTKEVMDIVDKTPTCTLPYAWGSMMYKPEFVKFVVAEEPHLGYAIMPAIRSGWKVKVVVADQCEYYDCGTLQEYVDLLNKLAQH